MVNLEPRYKVKELPIRIGELSRITGVPASRLRFLRKARSASQSDAERERL